MSVKNISNDSLKRRIRSVNEYIDGLNEALNYLPPQSILGRLSLQATIKKQHKKLEKLMLEYEKRGDTDRTDKNFI